MINSSNASPLITVCIPSYNHARFVGEAIQSVINQTYSNVELIVIDDGSEDNSVEVIESFRNVCERRFARFEIRSRPNKGLAATLNEALTWSNGGFFSIVGSDDIVLPSKLDVLLPELLQREYLAGVFGGVELIDDHGVTHGIKSRAGVWGFKEIFLAKAHLLAPTSLLKADILKDLGGFESETIIEDWSTWLKITASGRFKLAAVPNIVAKYRIHTTNTHKRVKDMHDARVSIIGQYANHPQFRNAMASAYATSAIALAGTSKRESLAYLRRSHGAPARSILHALFKLIAPRFLIVLIKNINKYNLFLLVTSKSNLRL